MNETTRETLAAIQRMRDAGVTTTDQALLAAYKLGEFDGMLKMAAVGQEKVARLLKEAA